MLIDRIMLWLRPFLFAAIYIAVPIYTLSLGWAIKVLLENVNGYLALVIMASHLICYLAIGSLFDKRQGR